MMMPVSVSVVVTMLVWVPVGGVFRVPFIDRLHTGSDRHLGGRLRVEHLAQQQHERRPEQREQRNQPDLV
jgi:hypothetical protein